MPDLVHAVRQGRRNLESPGPITCPQLHELAAEIFESQAAGPNLEGLARLRHLHYLQGKCLKRLKTFAWPGSGGTGRVAREAALHGQSAWVQHSAEREGERTLSQNQSRCIPEPQNSSRRDQQGAATPKTVEQDTVTPVLR